MSPLENADWNRVSETLVNTLILKKEAQLHACVVRWSVINTLVRAKFKINLTYVAVVSQFFSLCNNSFDTLCNLFGMF